MKVTPEMLVRWRPAMIEVKRELQRKGKLAGFKVVAKYAQEDSDFLSWWKCEVEGYPEPIRHRARSFLRRLENRDESWDFDREFRKSFN